MTLLVASQNPWLAIFITAAMFNVESETFETRFYYNTGMVYMKLQYLLLR